MAWQTTVQLLHNGGGQTIGKREYLLPVGKCISKRQLYLQA